MGGPVSTDHVIAEVSHSWIGIAIGKIEIRRRSTREKLRDALPDEAWPMANAMLNAGVIRDRDFLHLWNQRALEWKGKRLERNGPARLFDFAFAGLHGLQICALTAFCVAAEAAVAWLIPPMVLGGVVIHYYVTPHRMATQVLDSTINQGEE